MGNGQDLNALLGKLLRIDVNREPYAIPSSNPFANQPGVRPEIWASGLRNPWRFSFDRATRDLYIADVGQNTFEEIDFQPASSPGGENYGWRLMEGKHCFNPRTNCNPSGLTLPVLDRLGFADEAIFTTLENRMKCGLGKCGRCNIGPVYVCKAGPVFTAAQLKELPAEY
jgi:hypothetical protein